MFLHPVTDSSFNMTFTNGNLTLKASIADATPEGVEEEVDYSQPVDEQQIAVSGWNTGDEPGDEVEVNPNVIQTVHTGDRASSK